MHTPTPEEIIDEIVSTSKTHLAQMNQLIKLFEAALLAEKNKNSPRAIELHKYLATVISLKITATTVLDAASAFQQNKTEANARNLTNAMVKDSAQLGYYTVHTQMQYKNLLVTFQKKNPLFMKN